MLCSLSVNLKFANQRFTSLAIVEIHFSSFFLVWYLGSLDQILRQSVKFTYLIRLLIYSKRAHLRKNKGGSFLPPKFSQQFTTLGDYISSYVNTLKSLKCQCRYKNRYLLHRLRRLISEDMAKTISLIQFSEILSQVDYFTSLSVHLIYTWVLFISLGWC